MASLLSYVLLAVTSWVSYEWYSFSSTRNKLSAIPTVGTESFFLAYLSAWRFVFSGRDMIQEGYNKYPNGLFKVATLETGSRWLVIVKDEALLKEVKDARDDVLSVNQSAVDLLQARYTFSDRDAEAEPFHSNSVRVGLTKSLATKFSDITNEIEESFQDLLPASEEWTGHAIIPTLLPIVCRTSNRLFVGKPLCRDPEYMKLQQNFAVHVMVAATIVNLTPFFLKRIVGYFVSSVQSTVNQLRKMMEVTVAERIRMDAEHGKKYEGRPSDLISWLLDTAPAEYRTVYDMILRLIIVNFAAIHTTSITASTTLLELVSRPEYIDPLRQEIEDTIAQHGWTKESMGQMHKLDSFIKEIARLKGLAATSMMRKAMKDFTFSNGIVIPAGVTLAAPTGSVHVDSSLYDDPNEFKGFRFSDKHESQLDSDSPQARLKSQLVNPSSDFLFFGLGKHACPGRFFAANEIKCIVAHILVNYDLKAPKEPYPPAKWLGSQLIPNDKVQILFRKRQKV